MAEKTTDYHKGFKKGFEAGFKIGFKCSCNLFNKVVATNLNDMLKTIKKITK